MGLSLSFNWRGSLSDEHGLTVAAANLSPIQSAASSSQQHLYSPLASTIREHFSKQTITLQGLALSELLLLLLFYSVLLLNSQIEYDLFVID